MHSACKVVQLSQPWVLSKQKGGIYLIRTLEAYKGHQSLKWMGTEELELEKWPCLGSCTCVECNWGSGLRREVTTSVAWTVPSSHPPLGWPASQGPKHRETHA